MSIYDSTPRWCKLLYVRHNVEDNFVDSQFFSSSKTDSRRARLHSYWPLVRATVSITQHLSLVVLLPTIFFIIWSAKDRGTEHIPEKWHMSARRLLGLDITLFVAGYVLEIALKQKTPSDGGRKLVGGDLVRSVLVAFGYLWMLSPVLQTLTKAFSDDTVVALTFIFLLIHAISYDYACTQRDDRVRSSTAVNSGMLAAVVLASRLDETLAVFAFLSFAIEIFALSPILGRLVSQRLPRVYLATTVASFIGTTLFLGFTVGGLVVLVYVAGNLFITFCGPFWFIRSMKYKHEMPGPWDLPRIPVYQ